MALQDGYRQLTTYDMEGAEAADLGSDCCSDVVFTCNLPLLLQVPLCKSSKSTYSLFTHVSGAYPNSTDLKL